MEICWDNLEKRGVYLSKKGFLVNKHGEQLSEKESCLYCGESFLAINYRKRKNIYCSHKCAYAMARVGVSTLSLYDTYAPQLDYAEEVQSCYNEKGLKLLQVRCTYCNQWYTPYIWAAVHRAQFLKGNKHREGEHRFYCSTGCKKACPIFGKQLYPRGFSPATSVEVSRDLRQMVLERDNWTCQKCGRLIKDVQLHCHHVDPKINNPIESADIDNCITLCVDCHKEAHSTIGCRYQDLKCK